MSVLAAVWLVSAAHGRAQDETPAGHDSVLRHHGLEPMRGIITRIDAAGVTMRGVTTTDTESIIPWHLVRDVDSEDFDDAWKRYAPVAEQIWRGVIRIQRGDPILAEPLFERLFEQYRGQASETALVVAEGLLRSRLARAANELAVVPWLEAARLHHAGVKTQAFADVSTVIDATTLLCPNLPPAWPRSSRLQRLRDELTAYDAQGDQVIAALAHQYLSFVNLALSSAAEPHDASRPEHPGVTLLADVFAVYQREIQAASATIDRAMRKASDWPVWAQAWMRYHLGHALLNQKDQPSRDLGLVQLAYAPARFRYTQPYLAGLALVEMADVLDERGEKEHAGALRRLVDERYPGHPAVELITSTRTTERKSRP